MSVPAIVESALGDAELVERVTLGSEDELFVSSESILLYRSEGLLSDESVEEYPHGADRLSVSDGRRKSRITLEYSLEGTREFKVPTAAVDAVVHPVLAGVLSGNEITEPGERVIQTFRFSELTVIVTSKRLVKHIGSAVWDEDYEEFLYEDVTGLTFESGSVATQVVLEVDGRQQRIKAPNEQASELRQRLQQAIFAVHDVDSLDELHEKVGLEDDSDSSRPTVDFGEGVDPLSTDTSDGEPGTGSAGLADDETASGRSAGERTAPNGRDAEPADVTREGTGIDAESPGQGANTAVTSFDSSDIESTTESADGDVLSRLDSLEAVVEQQTAILERQQNTIEQLIEELRRGR